MRIVDSWLKSQKPPCPSLFSYVILRVKMTKNSNKGRSLLIRFIAILLLSFLILLGCTPGEDQDIEKENSNTSTWKSSRADLSIIPKNDNAAYMTRLDKFCWEKDREEACNLSPRDPRDIAEDLILILVSNNDEIGVQNDYLL